MFGCKLFGISFDVLCESFVEFAEGVNDTIELFSHDLAENFEFLFALIFDLIERVVAATGFAGDFRRF